MGLFSSIKNVVSAPIKAAQSFVTAKVAPDTRAKVVNVANTALAILTKPIQSIVNLPKAVEKTKTESTASLVFQGATNALVVTAPFSAVGKTAITTAGKSILPVIQANPIKSAVGGTLLAGALVAQPAKTISAISQTPSSIANVGGNIANLIAEPSVENLKELVTENPVIVGGAIAGAAILGAKTIIPAITGARTIDAMQEQTAAIKESTGALLDAPITSKTTGKEVVATNQETPKSAETTRIVSTKSTGTRKKRKKKASIPENYNKININIDNDTFNNGRYSKKKYGRNR